MCFTEIIDVSCSSPIDVLRIALCIRNHCDTWIHSNKLIRAIKPATDQWLVLLYGSENVTAMRWLIIRFSRTFTSISLISVASSYWAILNRNDHNSFANNCFEWQRNCTDLILQRLTISLQRIQAWAIVNYLYGMERTRAYTDGLLYGWIAGPPGPMTSHALRVRLRSRCDSTSKSMAEFLRRNNKLARGLPTTGTDDCISWNLTWQLDLS